MATTRRPTAAATRTLRTAATVARWPVRSVASATLVSGLVAQHVQPTHVVDVGANRGQFAVAVLELMPTTHVVSFEPQPAQAAELAALTTRYPGRLDVRAIALAAQAGELPLYVNAHHQSSSLRPLTDTHLTAFPTATPAGQIVVPVDRLDHQLHADDIPPTSLLKLDVQGAERDVLDGASGILHRFEHLLVELSFTPLYGGEPLFDEMVAHITGLGFRFLRPVGHLLHPDTREYLQIDALFVADR